MNLHSTIWLSAIMAVVVVSVAAAADDDRTADLLKQPGVCGADFVFDEVPFQQCHASTIAEAGDRLVAAWFGGTREGKTDVGIWLARKENNQWTQPVEVATGVSPDGNRYPCWNPVLFQPESGSLMLFYKVGPSPRKWWGMLIRSTDGGRNWSEPRRLPDGILGPVKNKPVRLADKTLLAGSSTEHQGWRVHMESTPDEGKTWRKIVLATDGAKIDAIQPTILLHPNNRLQILCRSRQKHIAESWSADNGRTWSPMSLTSLPNPNSGIDAVTLRDGRHVLVYNPTKPLLGRWGGPRTPLAVAISSDGKQWETALVLENQPGEYSYPAVIQSRDGRVHVTYTWKRRKIKHVVLDPTKLGPHNIPGGR